MDALKVAEIWGDLVGRNTVDIDDDFFFDLDGNSLMAAAAVARTGEFSGVPLELRDLYLATTPRELAEHLAAIGARLAELSAAAPATGVLPAVAAALAELSAAAAERLLPAHTVVRTAGPEAQEAAGGRRTALLREHRGAGPCTVESADTGEAVLRRGDGLAFRLRLAGPVLEIDTVEVARHG
ncbi:phosphopantetheine-binding protein [Kitasatospora sp. NPDC059599]|uniref:phosphopantetheine-binding protein n=1 Tax=Kitasatospora sp. NPDC059599 TaxID=3346880 RepID=UPI0036B606CA